MLKINSIQTNNLKIKTNTKPQKNNSVSFKGPNDDFKTLLKSKNVSDKVFLGSIFLVGGVMATSRWIAKNVGNARQEEAQMFEIPYGSIPQTSWLNSKKR